MRREAPWRRRWAGAAWAMLLPLLGAGLPAPAAAKGLCLQQSALTQFCAAHPGRACAFADAAARRGESCADGRAVTEYQRQAIDLACAAGGDCAVLEAELCASITAYMAGGPVTDCVQPPASLIPPRDQLAESGPPAAGAGEDAAQDAAGAAAETPPEAAEPAPGAGSGTRLGGAGSGLPDTGLKRLPGGGALQPKRPPGIDADTSEAGN